MLISLLFFFACAVGGYTLIKELKLSFSPLLELLVSFVLGITGVTGLLFLLAWVIPFSEVSVAIEVGVLAAVSWWRLSQDKTNKVLTLLRSLKEAVWRLSFTEKAAIVFFVILVVWLFGRSLFYDGKGQLWAGDRLVWVDWPLHIAIASNFAWGQNFPPQNPTFAGIPLIYPFFSDFLSGVLWRLGAGLPAAFAVPGVVLTLVFFGLFVVVGNRLLRSPTSLMSIGALFLSLFWGGLGWVYWLQEAFADETTFVQTLLAPSREYTFWWDKGLWFFTFLYSEILPQRAFLFGLPLFFLVILLIYEAWEKRKLHYFTIAGVIGGLMPFFHTHSYISLVILAVTTGGIGAIGLIRNNKGYKKKYLEGVFLFFLPFGTLSVVQLPLFLPQTSGFPFHFGWMKENENFFLFWFKNTGFFMPLIILGLWKGKFIGFAKVLGWASLSLFIIPNLFQFAQWGYDNLKIFTYWYLIGSLFVMSAIGRIWRIGLIGRIGAIVLFVSLTLSGILEVGRLVDTSRAKVGLWPKEDHEFAQEVREKTPPDSVFLTSAIHDHPVASLAGRKIVIGFPGNSWSWGIKGWDERERDVHTMFQGGNEAKELWKKYGIDYIVVSDRERMFEKVLDEEYIAQNGEAVLEKGNTKVYKIR